MSPSIAPDALKRIETAFASVIMELVSKPDELVVSVETIGIEAHVLRVTVAASDVGRLVGKQGRTARALRVLLAAASITLGARVNLDIQHEAPEEKSEYAGP